MLSQNLKIRLKAKWRNLDPVWRYNTRHARKLYQDSVLHSNTGFNFILRDNGVGVLDKLVAEKFFPAYNFQELLAYQQSIKQRFSNQLKPFLVEYWPTGDVLDFNNPFVKLVLSREVLDTVADYLGCWPRLYDLRLWETKIMTNEAPVYSQSWHRDPEDKKLLNMFIYLNDVEEDGVGPFQYVSGSHSEGPHWNTLPQILPPQASYPKKGEVERLLGNKIYTAYGKAGTIIFADTVGLHRGGYSTTKPRLMFKALYISDGNFTGRKTRYSLPEVLPELTEQQKYAIGYE